VQAAESLEGGLNRNSSPHTIAFARAVYDLFLAKFPLFFGYWKKYADLEFSIAGTEAAEMVSTQLLHHCEFMSLTERRSTSEVSLASQPQSICGPTTAPSK
jgi:hypothetical protein